MANQFIARKGLIALDNSGISGSLDVSGSLTIESSGSTLFEIIGSEGQLFSVTDNLSGSLFAVSDVSGLPILEVFSDDTVKIGTFNNEGLIVGGTNVTASNLLASDVTISHTPSSSPTSLVIGNPPHLVHTIEIASGSTNVMRFASNTGNGGTHTIGFSGHTFANSMQTAIIGQAEGASGRVGLYFSLTGGDNTTATTSDAVLKLNYNDVNFYQKVHANDDTFEIGGSNTGDSILYLGAEKRTGIARDYRGAGNAADFVVMTMGSLGGTSVPATHTRLRVTKEGDTEISGSITASQNVDIQGILSIPGFTNVSSSLAAAVAGGDDLGNHTATQDLNMGGNAITNVGNVDGVDVSTLNSTVSTNTSNITTLTAATSSYSTAIGVENNADVTDTANVTAAGALMDSEVTNLAQVKAFDSSDYATAAQGTKADTAIQPSQTSSFSTATGVENNADVTDTTNVTAAGALMDSEVTNLAQVKAFDSSDYATAAQGTKADTAIQPADTGSFSTATGVENNADVTDTTNVTAAGALMDSEVTNLAQVKAFDSSDYATSTQGTKADNAATLIQLNASSSALQSNIDGKQATLTFGKSSGNALKSEEALTTNDILLAGSTNIKGRTYTELKSDLSLNNVTNESKATMFTSPTFTGTMAIPGFADVSASLAAASGGGGGDITGVTAGNGLTGGGSSGDVTLTVGAGTGVTVNSGDIAIGQDVATNATVEFDELTIGSVFSSGDIKLTTNNTQITQVLSGGATRDLIGFDGDDNAVIGNLTANKVKLVGAVTASGDISASGANAAFTAANIVGGVYKFTDGVKFANPSTSDPAGIEMGNQGDGNLLLNHLTASGDISASGTITGTINTSSITDFPTEVSRSAAAAGFSSGGGGGGNVSNTGTPVNDQIAVWTDATTVEGTTKLTFENSTITVHSANANGTGIEIYGGVYPTVTSWISPIGASNKMNFGDGTSGHIFDFLNNKIAFDGDSTNTYIQANTDVPEDLEIHADQDIILAADNAVVIGAVTDVEDRISSYRVVLQSNCYLSQATKIYLPFNSLSEQSNFNYISLTPAAANGQLISITVWPQSGGGSTVAGLHINSNGTATATDTQTLSSGAPTTFTFSGATFSQNDELSFSIDPTSNPNGFSAQIILEYDY